jgi:RNA-splicing ligase RtcB
MIELKGKYTTVKIMIDDVEETAMKQLYNMMNHPVFTNPISVMSDVHAGSGCVIGLTMPLSIEGIVPVTVGVDCGCGMLGVNFGKTLGMSRDKIDIEIRRNIPLGISIHEFPAIDFEKEFNWEKANENCRKFISKYNAKFGTNYKPVEYTYEWFIKKCKEIGIEFQKAVCSLQSLGGGNHYIEIGISDTNDYWITVHSGSRNFGLKICNYHQNKAKKQLEYKRNVLLRDKINEITKNTTDKTQVPNLIEQSKKDLKIFTSDTSLNGMEFLDGQLAIDYFTDMIFTQLYADFNRKRMKVSIDYILISTFLFFELGII